MSSYSEAESRAAAAAAEAARIRAHQERLRQLVRELRIAPADTTSLERNLAAVSVAKATLDRHLARQSTDLAAMARRTTAHADAITATCEAARRDAVAARTEMEQESAALAFTVGALDRQRAAAAAAAGQQLERELAADLRTAESIAARRHRLLERTDAIVADLAPADIGRAVLAAEAVMLCRRREASAALAGEEGLIAARQLFDDATTLAREVRWRTAKIDASASALATEIRQLLSQLAFSADARRLLVGEGAAALDAPLRRELERLGRRVADTTLTYDSLEHRVDDLSRAIAHVATEVERIGSDVQHFDELNRMRFALIDETLPVMLAEVAGQAVERIAETLPDLALKPVEVSYRVPLTGERIDCTVGLDGSVRVHHHQHTTERECAAAAEHLAAVMPRMLELVRPPTLDMGTPPPAVASPYVVRPALTERL